MGVNLVETLMGAAAGEGPTAYFGDRDRSFRRIVTVAQRVVSRGRIVMQSVTMSR